MASEGLAAEPATRARPTRAVFLEGSILRHVIVMTATGAVGLIAIFFVDLLTLVYISWLENPKMTAGIGLATQLSFFFIALQIGFSIAVTALVSQALGRGDRREARRIATSSMIHIAWITGLATLLVWPFCREMAYFVGARGETLDHATLFLQITLPSNTLLAVGMALSGVLRAAGDAARAMYVTLGGAVVISILDPIFILYLRWDVVGAGISTFGSRMAFLVVGLWGAVRVRKLLGRADQATIRRCLRPLMMVAVPAMVTNLAAPVANIYALRVFAQFGDAAIAGMSIIDRIIPIAFGVLFAMSGAVGPIVGQNFGARKFDRVVSTLTNCYGVAIVYGLFIWAVLWLFSPFIVWLFDARGTTAAMILFFCKVGAGGWLFLGCLFAANAAFNNLGYPVLATVFNWGRATLGVIPFVTLGAHYGGPNGALLGVALGGVFFGLAAMAVSYRLTARLARRMG